MKENIYLTKEEFEAVIKLEQENFCEIIGPDIKRYNKSTWYYAEINMEKETHHCIGKTIDEVNKNLAEKIKREIIKTIGCEQSNPIPLVTVETKIVSV